MTLLVGNLGRSLTTGLSESFNMLIEAFAESRRPYLVHDLDVGLRGAVGDMGLLRGWRTLRMIAAYLFKLRKVRQVYMTISSSRYGFARDAVLILAASAFGKRLVLHLHGAGYRDFFKGESRLLKPLIAWVIGLAETIIVLDEGLKNQFSFLSTKQVKIVAVPNGLPRGVMARARSRGPRDLSLPMSMLYLSHLSVSKGYLVLLEACRLLKHEYCMDFRCRFCGSFVVYSMEGKRLGPNELEEEFLRLVRVWDLEDVVTCVGVVSGAKRQHELDNADLFVLPTTHPWEGQPLSIIEAMAVGTPIVTTTQGGIPGQVVDRYNGLIVDGKSARSLAKSILEVAQEPLLYRELSRNALERYYNEFTSELHVERIMEILSQV